MSAQTEGTGFKLATYAEDENPGSSSLNNNWQLLTQYLNQLQDQITALTGQYVTQQALANTENALSQADQQNFDALNGNINTVASRLNSKADFYTVDTAGLGTETYQIANAAEMIYNGREEVFVDGADVATKAWVGQQGYSVASTGERPSMYAKVQITFDDGGEWRSSTVWIRIQAGVITAWAPGSMALSSVLASEGNWFKGAIDPTLL